MEFYASDIAPLLTQLAYWVRSREAKQRDTLQKWLHELIHSLEGRIYEFNVGVAHVWADQKVLLERAGKAMPIEDSYIAATARRHGLTIVPVKELSCRR